MNYLKVLSDLYNAKGNTKKSAAQIKKLRQKGLRNYFDIIGFSQYDTKKVAV